MMKKRILALLLSATLLLSLTAPAALAGEDEMEDTTIETTVEQTVGEEDASEIAEMEPDDADTEDNDGENGENETAGTDSEDTEETNSKTTGDAENLIEPAENAACDMCGQTDGHLVGCLATFTEVDQIGYFVSDSVTLYKNPTRLPDVAKTFTADQLPESFTVQYSFPGAAGVTWYVLDTENWDLFADTDAPYSYVQSDYVTFDLDTEEKTTLTDEDSGVQVSGNLPEGTSLSVRAATLEEIKNKDPSLAGIPEQYIGMDISLLRDGTEYQPSKSVTVSMDVSDVASAGEDVLVYHVHENEDGTVTTELLGPFEVGEDGNVDFDMDNFSYVLVFSGKAEYTINAVSVFYPVLEAPSGNGHYQFLGIYYDENNDLHFLLATCDKTPSEAEDKFVSFYIDNKQYIVSTMGDNVQQVEVLTYSKVEFKDSETGAVLDTVSITENKGVAKGFYDVNVGQQEVGQSFGFAVSQDSNMPSGSQAWNINGMVKVDLDYELIKTVAAGTSTTGSFGESVTVDRGDWVIFKINVNNNGDRPLTDMLVQDILPEGVFDMNTVQMSIDGENGEIGNWQDFNSTLFSDYDSEGHFSRILYIKAQVNPELSITADTTYTNKATIDGMNMPTYEDTADVIVKAPTTGTLTVSKAVTSENPNDPAPDTAFTFTVHSDAANAGPFNYTKSDGTTGSVANNGTFTLKNGESIAFSDFPVGDFTVTETDAAGFATKVNGNAGTVYTGNMTSLAAPVVAFENQFSTRMATLSISKEVKQEYAGDTPEIPEGGFAFTVVIGDGTDTTTAYPYTIGETAGTITSGGTIKLGHGETAVISNIPVGTAYTVTENLGDLSDDYTTTVNRTAGTVASGTMQVSGSEADFVNTYKKHVADLTIKKTGWDSLDENQTFIFKVYQGQGESKTYFTTVTIHGNGSVVIKDLPVGVYTVEEDETWSWRYSVEKVTVDDSEIAGTNGAYTVTVPAGGETVTFSNERDGTQWLDGNTWCRNIFDGVITGTVDGSAVVNNEKRPKEDEPASGEE